MKKKLILICLIFTVGFVMYADSDDGVYAIRLSGGAGNTMGGDMPRLMDGLNDQFADLATMMGASVSDKIRKANLGPEFEAELLIRILKNVDVGIGLGYLTRNRDSRSELNHSNGDYIRFRWQPSYKVIPLLLSGYYRIPLTAGLQFSIRGGAGYYFINGDLNLRIDNTTVSDGDFWETTEVTTSRKGLGFHGGIALNQRLSRVITLFFELGGRYVQHSDWDVKSIETNSYGETERESGTFWFYDEYDPVTHKTYDSMTVSEEKPHPYNGSNVRKAEIGLSGFSVKVGLKISIG